METFKYIDKKKKHLINYYYNCFKDDSFDEYDVYAFFILVRDFAKDSSFTKKYNKENWIIEICDLIAHRERDRGLIYDSVVAIKKIEANHSGRIPNSKGIYSVGFVPVFNDLLETMGYERLSSKTIVDILLCACSIMQFTVYQGGYVYIEY